MTQSIPEMAVPAVDLDAIRAKATAFDNARDDFQAAFNPATIEQARAELSAAAMESAATVPYLLDEIARLTGIVERLRVFEAAVLHATVLAADEYRQPIVAARCVGANADADYWRWCGQAAGIRQTIDALASRAGVPAPDWEQIKASVPADGIYR